jgi:hypothetical protein
MNWVKENIDKLEQSNYSERRHYFKLLVYNITKEPFNKIL